LAVIRNNRLKDDAAVEWYLRQGQRRCVRHARQKEQPQKKISSWVSIC